MKAMLSYREVWLRTQGPNMAFSGMSQVVYTLVKMSVRHCWTALASPSQMPLWMPDSSIAKGRYTGQEASCHCLFCYEPRQSISTATRHIFFALAGVFYIAPILKIKQTNLAGFKDANFEVYSLLLNIWNGKLESMFPARETENKELVNIR